MATTSKSIDFSGIKSTLIRNAEGSVAYNINFPRQFRELAGDTVKLIRDDLAAKPFSIHIATSDFTVGNWEENVVSIWGRSWHLMNTDVRYAVTRYIEQTAAKIDSMYQLKERR